MQGPSACWKGRCGQQRGPALPRGGRQEVARGACAGAGWSPPRPGGSGERIPVHPDKVHFSAQETEPFTIGARRRVAQQDKSGWCLWAWPLCRPPSGPAEAARPGTRPRRPGWCVMTAPDRDRSCQRFSRGPCLHPGRMDSLDGPPCPGQRPHGPRREQLRRASLQMGWRRHSDIRRLTKLQGHCGDSPRTG